MFLNQHLSKHEPLHCCSNNVCNFHHFYSQRKEVTEFPINSMQVMTAEHFWEQHHGAELNNLLVYQDIQYNREKLEEQSPVHHIMLEEKNMVNKTRKRRPLRVVHLDLKGAAPKVSYFQQVRELKCVTLTMNAFKYSGHT